MNKITSLIAVVTITIFAAGLSGAEPTSKDNDRLRAGLKKFPQADTNGDGVLTMTEARAFMKKRREARQKGQGKGPKPTHADVAYGSDERNKLDLWLAKSEKPTPLLVLIHGGGFRGGDKKKYHSSGLIPQMHAAGISVASAPHGYCRVRSDQSFQ